MTSTCLITMREMIMKLAMAGQQIGSKFIVTRGKELLEYFWCLMFFLLNFTGRMTAVSVTACTPSPKRGAIIGKYHICVCIAPQLRKWLRSRWIVLIMQWLELPKGAVGAAFGQWGPPWYKSQNIQIISKTSKSARVPQEPEAIGNPENQKLLKSTEAFLQMCHCWCLFNPSAAGDALKCLDKNIWHKTVAGAKLGFRLSCVLIKLLFDDNVATLLLYSHCTNIFIPKHGSKS